MRNSPCFLRAARLALALLATATLATAQSYRLDSSTVDGGGGVCHGGNYTLAGTIGQPDASRALAGGSFTMLGGFWAGLAPADPAPPELHIALVPGGVRLFWPSAAAGFRLQQSNHLSPTDWQNVASVPTDDGTWRSVLLTSSTAQQFFRLAR